MEKQIDFRVLHFINEAIKSHHYKERAEILTSIYCAQEAKKEFEAKNTGREHMHDAWIARGEEQLKELNDFYNQAREFLKSLDDLI